MATERDYQGLFDRVAALREQVANNLSADLISNPQLADALTKQIDDLLASVVSADGGTPPPPDAGLSALAGGGARAFRRGSPPTTTRSRRNGSWRSEICIISGSTRRSASSASCRSCKSSSGRAPFGFRAARAPSPSTSSIAVRCCVIPVMTASPPIAGCSATAALRRRPAAGPKQQFLFLFFSLFFSFVWQ